MDELIDAARREWARANIQQDESYFAFAQRIGVSYRTVLRWIGRQSTRPNIVRRALERRKPTQPFDIAVLPKPLQWSNAEIQTYYGPLVYVVLKDGHAQYVGSSKMGAFRLFNSHDHEDVIRAASAILFYRCPTRADAARLEAQLIRQYEPLLNINKT